MKDTQKNEQDQKKEYITEKKGSPTHTSKRNREASYLTALAQGTIPQTLGAELFAGLSKLGNSAFLQALERTNDLKNEFQKYVDAETFTEDKVSLLKERLAANPTQAVNEVEILPAMNRYQPLPSPVNEEDHLSALMPFSFDQGVSKE